ncbi:MCE family protein [candidate division WOR-3 bacterium]|uniref:MCE family protein n=1 Tax=candidate division WOR-3 bacterium TaxID=2052148 RepID=A0A9D5KB49_UNCW3|nr:MCE family protein [candidate division WOR-3 bacterium]MBD3364915.1 MCE family protein [candidate division WOR-3 bacterium]
MNDERRREIAAGIFLFFGLLILLFGISWLKDYWSLRKTYEVKVTFKDITSLRMSDPVDIAGVIKGKVTDVEIRDKDILVTLNIEEDMEIPVDSRISMRTRSIFTGERFIKVDLGESDSMARNYPGHVFEGMYIDDFSLEHLQRTLIRIEALLSQLEIEGIQKVIEEGLGDIFTEAKEGIEPIAERGEKMGEAIDDLASASESLEELLARLEQGEGSLGKLLEDDTVYVNIKEASEELKLLIEDIRENPDRYINLKVF